MPAIEAVRLLDCVSPDWREQAKCTKTVTLLPKGISDGVKKWGEGIVQENFQKINRYVGYGRDRPTDKVKTLSRPQSRSQYVGLFLEKAIAADITTPEASGSSQRSPVKVKVKVKSAAGDGKHSRPRATRGHKLVSFVALTEVITKYSPSALTTRASVMERNDLQPLSAYAFIDDE